MSANIIKSALNQLVWYASIIWWTNVSQYFVIASQDIYPFDAVKRKYEIVNKLLLLSFLHMKTSVRIVWYHFSMCRCSIAYYYFCFFFFACIFCKRNGSITQYQLFSVGASFYPINSMDIYVMLYRDETQINYLFMDKRK